VNNTTGNMWCYPSKVKTYQLVGQQSFINETDVYLNDYDTIKDGIHYVQTRVCHNSFISARTWFARVSLLFYGVYLYSLY
jgi:hypothetical protein